MCSTINYTDWRCLFREPLVLSAPLLLRVFHRNGPLLLAQIDACRFACPPTVNWFPNCLHFHTLIFLKFSEASRITLFLRFFGHFPTSAFTRGFSLCCLSSTTLLYCIIPELRVVQLDLVTCLGYRASNFTVILYRSHFFTAKNLEITLRKIIFRCVRICFCFFVSSLCIISHLRIDFFVLIFNHLCNFS